MKQKNYKGAGLIVAVMLVVVTAILLAGVLFMVRHNIVVTNENVSNTTLYYAAQSGALEMVNLLKKEYKRNPDKFQNAVTATNYSDENFQTPYQTSFSGVDVSVTVDFDSTADGWKVLSVATKGDKRCIVTADGSTSNSSGGCPAVIPTDMRIYQYFEGCDIFYGRLNLFNSPLRMRMNYTDYNKTIVAYPVFKDGIALNAKTKEFKSGFFNGGANQPFETSLISHSQAVYNRLSLQYLNGISIHGDERNGASQNMIDLVDDALMNKIFNSKGVENALSKIDVTSDQNMIKQGNFHKNYYDFAKRGLRSYTNSNDTTLILEDGSKSYNVGTKSSSGGKSREDVIIKLRGGNAEITSTNIDTGLREVTSISLAEYSVITIPELSVGYKVEIEGNISDKINSYGGVSIITPNSVRITGDLYNSALERYKNQSDISDQDAKDIQQFLDKSTTRIAVIVTNSSETYNAETNSVAEIGEGSALNYKNIWIQSTNQTNKADGKIFLLNAILNGGKLDTYTTDAAKNGSGYGWGRLGRMVLAGTFIGSSVPRMSQIPSYSDDVTRRVGLATTYINDPGFGKSSPKGLNTKYFASALKINSSTGEVIPFGSINNISWNISYKK